MSVTLESIVAKLRAARLSLCSECKRALSIEGRSRCNDCYKRQTARRMRIRRGGSTAPYRARIAQESCCCGSSACDGRRCESIRYGTAL